MKLGKTFAYLIVLFVTAGIFSSCNPFAVQGPEPAFIDITEASFSHPLDEGPRLHRIEHVEIFFEGFSIGFYEIPAEIAVIPTMEVSEMQIFPAVQLDGDLTKITKYEAMSEFTATQSFQIGETYVITPEFDYRDNMVFDYVETFETGNSLNFDADEVDSTMTERIGTDPSDGNFSCLISTEKNGSIVTATNFLFTGLDNNGKDVFVEFEYKADASFVMGMRAEGNNNTLLVPFITIVPRSSSWRKIYINITSLIQTVQAPGYRLYFEAQGGEGEFANEVFIDNLKILHQQ